MIETKLVNGLKVVYNSTRNLTIVTLSDNRIRELQDFLGENPEATVLIHPTNYGGEYGLTFDVEDLDVLNELDMIKRIILIVDRKINSYAGIFCLKNLVEIDAWLASSVDFDFSFFKKLESISFNWTPRTKHFFESRCLKNIGVWKYKSKDKTLLEFPSLHDTQSLGIIQSNITSIKGIESLRSLKALELAYNSNLEIKMEEFGFTFSNVEELEINCCKKVGLDFIKIFPNLRKLNLVKFQDLQALKPILDGLPSLEEIFVGETKIEESDNAYYLDYHNIKKFFFDDRKHHKIKNKDLKKDSQ